MRPVVLLLALVLALTACGLKVTGPPGQLSSTDVNPESGDRGGTSSSSSHR